MNKISHDEILKKCFELNECDIKLFQTNWMKLIEDDYWLSFDKPFDGVTKYLNLLKNSGYKLYLVTHRQKKGKVITQINTFGWYHIFEKILVTEQKHRKSDLIKPNLGDDKNNWMVGDTGMDIIEGQELNMNTIAVLSGFLSEKKLSKYNPDKIIPTVLHFNPSKKI